MNKFQYATISANKTSFARKKSMYKFYKEKDHATSFMKNI